MNAGSGSSVAVPAKLFGAGIFWAGVMLLLGLFAGWVTAEAVGRGENLLLLCYFVAFLLGVLTGAAELFPKYRDDPMRAALCPAGIIYLLLNGIVSLVAFIGVWNLYRAELGMVDTAGQPITKTALKYAVFSGLGAMALLRSRFFKVTLKDGHEVSVGPDHIVSTLLESTDSYIDRHRANIRANLVEEKFSKLDFASLHPYAVTLIFGASQTLSMNQQAELGKQIAAIEASRISDRDKSMQIGFLVINYLGEDFVRSYSFDVPNRVPPAETSRSGPGEKVPVAVKKASG